VVESLFNRLVSSSVLLTDSVQLIKRQASFLGNRLRSALSEVTRQSRSVKKKHELQWHWPRALDPVVMPSGNEHDVVGFDLQFGAVHECESFSADDIKELVGLLMDVNTRRCTCSHGVPEHLHTLRSGSRTCLDEGLSFSWQSLAFAGLQHTAALL